MSPAYYNFSPHVSGDTFFGAKFDIYDKDRNPIDLTSSMVRMQIRTTPGNKIVTEWSTADGSIIVTVNEIALQQKVVSAPEFAYLYDIQVTYPDQSIVTLVAGLFPVKSDVTR